MATASECESALRELSRIIGEGAGPGERALRRTVSCRVTDLDLTFVGLLRQAALQDLRPAEANDRRADIRITTTSDDLVEMVAGSLGVTAAWTRGRVKIDASVMDLLRLRKLF